MINMGSFMKGEDKHSHLQDSKCYFVKRGIVNQKSLNKIFRSNNGIFRIL